MRPLARPSTRTKILLSEDDLIELYFAPIAGPGGLGLLDDAALIGPPPGCDLVVTADALVAGVHFFGDDPPFSIARKCLGVNLSDLAAKGAVPLGFVLTLALPPAWTQDWLAAFAGGLGQEAAAFACPLLGGDTVRTPGPLCVSITALGSVPAGRMVPRTGARPGDLIYVTGTIGDGALGLQLRLRPESIGPLIGQEEREALLDRFLHPRPRLALTAILGRYATGGMDVSDGLVGDLRKMMRASKASAEVELARVPLSVAAQALIDRSPDLFDVAMTGGDDYEILATVPAGDAAAFERGAAEAGVRVTMIGTVGPAGAATSFKDRHGREAPFGRGSFSHF